MRRSSLHALPAFCALLVLAILAATLGCASPPGPYQKAVISRPFKSKPADPQFVTGRKNVVIDGLGHYLFSLPTKFILWNWGM